MLLVFCISVTGGAEASGVIGREGQQTNRMVSKVYEFGRDNFDRMKAACIEIGQRTDSCDSQSCWSIQVI